MTLSQAINMVDNIKPNAFSDEIKTAWLNEVEGLVQTEVLLLAIEDVKTYRYDRDHGAELLAKPPHDKIYWTYLSAMVDFGNGEYNKYQNTMQLFNSFFAEYQGWFALRYRPADGEAEEQGYYISAYGIAVRHGYEGTEEEWLASLQGKDGAVSFEGLTEAEKAELKGEPGKAATISIGKTETGAAANVKNSGTANAAVFDFTLPAGPTGPAGAAATISIGSVTTGAAGTAANVKNSGTANAAVLDFVIPKGDTGASGSGTGDMVAAVYDPAGGAKQVAFNVDLESHIEDDAMHVSAADRAAWNAKVTALTAESTDGQYPSAKCVYEFVEAKISGAIGGGY